MTQARTIQTRRIAFDRVAGMPRHFAGDPVQSHVVAVLSSLFPEGEDFFVRSVRNVRDQITDPELKRAVAGFIGQEAIHGREHRAFNDRLAELGYPTRLIDRLTKYGLAFLAKVTPKADQLAVTAALEHYTATLAETLMSRPEARDLLAFDEARSLLLWHAVEESEHKAVAFDVYQAVCGDPRRRRRVMNMTTVIFLGAVIEGVIGSMAIDPSTYLHPVRTARSLAGLRSNPWLAKAVRDRIREYNRPDFHPDDFDATVLLDEWRAALFGAEGTLRDRLKVSA